MPRIAKRNMHRQTPVEEEEVENMFEDEEDEFEYASEMNRPRFGSTRTRDGRTSATRGRRWGFEQDQIDYSFISRKE